MASDDDAAVLLLCRQALGGPKDPGRSSYQIARTVCESCRRGKQQGRGELIEVGPEIVEMAECDGQRIGHVNATRLGTYGDGQLVIPSIHPWSSAAPLASAIVLASGGMPTVLPRWLIRSQITLLV
jgi:hypothetical protein